MKSVRNVEWRCRTGRLAATVTRTATLLGHSWRWWMCWRPLAYLISLWPSVCSRTRRNSSKQLSKASIQFTDNSNQPLINKIDQTFLWELSEVWATFGRDTLPSQKGHAEREEERVSCRLALTVYQSETGDGPRSQSIIDKGLVNCHGGKPRSQLHGILMQSLGTVINGLTLKDNLENNCLESKTCQGG